MRKLRKTTKIKAKKSLGQNFLRDPKILKKIADFAQIKKEDVVVEIGPGEGTLTKLLLERAKKVMAIEKDEELCKFLSIKFRKEILAGKLEVVSGNVLNYELRIKNYALIGNIPYYITGALFRKFLEAENKPSSIIFVVQKEVAERIIVKDGKESILSISIKAYGTPYFGGVIKAGSFFPKPKVDSAIISVRNISREKFENTEQKSSCSESPRISSLRSARLSSQDFFAQHAENLEKRFFEILKAGFAHKRKLLIKNLGKVSKGIFELPRSQKMPFDTLKEAFEKCGISEKARAENLKVENWLCLTKELG